MFNALLQFIVGHVFGVAENGIYTALLQRRTGNSLQRMIRIDKGSLPRAQVHVDAVFCDIALRINALLWQDEKDRPRADVAELTQHIGAGYLKILDQKDAAHLGPG